MEVGGVVIALVALAAYSRHETRDRAEDVRRGQLPEPHTITELRSINKLSAMKQCSFSEITPSSNWRPMPATDVGFKVSLPIPWHFQSVDTLVMLFKDPRVTFADARDSKISVMRKAYGNSGRTFLADSVEAIAPERECEVSNDSAGTIWSLYSRPRENGEIRYTGLADAVTASGRHYHISVTAGAASNRDSLAAILADAILHQ